MHRKNRNTSLCYGFIFNLLVALCTIAFMCYFLYRFDTRLLSLERRLWDIQHDKGVSAVNRERLTLFKKGNRNKEDILTGKIWWIEPFNTGFCRSMILKIPVLNDCSPAPLPKYRPCVVTCCSQFSLELYRSRMTIIFVWISSTADLYYYVTACNICVPVKCTWVRKNVLVLFFANNHLRIMRFNLTLHKFAHVM